MPAKKEKLYTLTELSKKSGISMPTLQRYKKLYQDRIPSVGEGRKQRYPEAAIKAVQKLKAENVKKRGRRKAAPAKKAAAAKRPRGAKKRAPRKRAAGSRRARPKAKPAAKLLSLSEISRITGISYPTLAKYAKLYIERIPHEGEGRRRRYYPKAVDVFREIRASSRRGPARKSGAGAKKAPARRGRATGRALANRVRSLERSQRDLARKLDAVLKQLKRPLQVTVKRR